MEEGNATAGSLMDIRTAKATQEAMNTPLTIPHSKTVGSPPSTGPKNMPTERSARPPVQLQGRKDDTPKVLTPTIANKVFGAYLNEPIRLSPSFYGQGTSFLWKAFRSSPESRRKDAIKCFKYTGGNEYFVLCDPDFVAIGGGRGKFGLWFKSDFLHGYSARCPTFNNEPLCLDPSSSKNADVDAQQEFVVGHLEIWAFD
ncbi:oxidation resistance protein 1 [Coemansia sp. RSA 2559]|nr:oxidation resistance protein 1 [Coemansia sp. RSA 2559]